MKEFRVIIAAISIVVIVVVSTFTLTYVEHYSFSLPAKTTIVFTEKGLPAGQMWEITLHEQTSLSYQNYSMYYSNDTTMKITVSNNDYNFSVTAPNGYVSYEKNGNITQSHYTYRSIGISFSKLYNVTFVESGLPSSVHWMIVVYKPMNGNPPYSPPNLPPVYAENTGVFNSTTVQLPNGSFTFALEYSSTNPIYLPVYSSTVDVLGNAALNVSGKNLTVPVLLTKTGYALKVSESGFPPGLSSWVFNISGFASTANWFSSSGSYGYVLFTLPNGTYQYQAETAKGYTSTNENGITTINGNDKTLVIDYKS